jgi:uncharacterized membrane protein
VSTAPAFLTYLLSFVFVGIYWNNHHHLLHTAHHINGSILWANLHLLFWLSLAPFVTAWMGQNHLAPGPVASYGGVLLCAAVAYFVLTRALLSAHGKDSKLAKALGNDFKGKVSMLIYAAAIPLAFVHPPAALMPAVCIGRYHVARPRSAHREGADGSVKVNGATRSRPWDKTWFDSPSTGPDRTCRIQVRDFIAR